MKYPKIIRDNVDFNNDSDVCNMGYYENVLDDERPVRIEFWYFAGINMATCFLSNIDLEEKDLKKYLVNKQLFSIDRDKIEVNIINDLDDNIFYSINIPLDSKDMIYNKCLVKMDDYL